MHAERMPGTIIVGLNRLRKVCCLLLPMVLICILLSFHPQRANGGEAYAEISAPLLKHLMETDKTVVVINVLSDIEYEMHHITGSINIPINVLTDSPKLPTDKSRAIVFYCMGTR